MEITNEQVKDFWKYMSTTYRFEIVSKEDAREMQIIAWALDQMQIQTKEKFLKSFTTTICLGGWRSVYVPFEIGNESQKPLIDQIVTCVHESQHVVQADREPAQPMKYLTSDASRAFYEADAYRTNMEMHWFLTGELLSPKTLSDKLTYYSIGTADRRIARKHLIIASRAVMHGGVISGTSKTAIKWWRKQFPNKPYKGSEIFPAVKLIGVGNGKRLGRI